MKNILKLGVPSVIFFTPAFTLAQFGEINTFFEGLTNVIQSVIIPVLLAIAFLVFIYGAVKYFFVADEGSGEDNRESGRRLMFWGIIGFVVIVSVWGLTLLLVEGLGLDDRNLEDIPDAPAGVGAGAPGASPLPPR